MDVGSLRPCSRPRASLRARRRGPGRQQARENGLEPSSRHVRVPCVGAAGVQHAGALFHQRPILGQTVPIPVPRYGSFTPSSGIASKVKRANRADRGRAELELRLGLRRLGARFQTNVSALPGKPDLVFPAEHVCVFCDGDFWHGRHWDKLAKRLARGKNAAYWIPKIARNRQRDRAQSRRLRTDGWTIMRVWETDVLADHERAANRIQQIVRRRGSP